MMDNRQRATLAGDALAFYAAHTRHDGRADGSAIVDLLSDLRHWCDTQDIVWQGVLNWAEKHYKCETDEPDDIELAERNDNA
jgi:hypothetical protein